MYLMVLRPWSFSASMAPVALGTVLSWRDTNQFSLQTLIFTTIVVCSVHAAVNFSQACHHHLCTVDNTVIDKSAPREQEAHTTTDKTLEKFVRLGTVLYAVSLLAFLGVCYSSSARIEQLAFLFFGGLSASFMYTGRISGASPKLHSSNLDDLIVVTFVPVAVLLPYLAQCGEMHFKPLLYAVPLALNTEAILHSENSRDLERDKVHGIVTAATILGPAGSYAFYLFLLFTPYIIFSVMFLKVSLFYFLPLITLRAAFDLEKLFRNRNMAIVPVRTAKLNAYLAIIYVLVNF